MFKNFVWISIGFFFAAHSVAQGVSDSTQASSLRPVKIYFQSLGEQSPLFNGREYVDYAATIHVGHPYFETTEFSRGIIHYDGMIFNDAMILFDIVKEKVIIQHFNRVFRIDLPVEKITEFSFDDHHFIKLYPDSGKVISEGFYEKLYEGKSTLYVKRRKMVRVDRTGNDITNVIDEHNTFYVVKNGVFHTVRNMSSLLNTFSTKREGIRQQLKKNGIKYRRNAEKAVLMAVQYYDRSSN